MERHYSIKALLRHRKELSKHMLCTLMDWSLIHIELIVFKIHSF